VTARIGGPPTEWLVGDTLVRSAERDAGAVAVEVDGESRTYEALLAESLRLAAGLRSLGLERGGRVVIQTTNSWETAVALYGTTLADGVFVVVNPQTKADKLGYMLADSTGKWKLAPIALRTTLAFHRSTVPGRATVAVAASAAAVRTIVPTLPGSWTASRTSSVSGVALMKSVSDRCGISAIARTPCGDSVSAALAKSRSDSSAAGTSGREASD